MPASASELFIVDNSDNEWKVCNCLADWWELSKTIDIATGSFEIGALLALKDKWQQVDSIRLLMRDEVSKRTKRAFEEGLNKIATALDASLESEKKANDFLSGVLIRSLPDTPIHHALDRAGLSKLREKVEKELIKTHLRPLQVPVGVSPVLKCWMEVS